MHALAKDERNSASLPLPFPPPPSPSAVTEAGKKGDSLAQTFFMKEYTLNHLIGTSTSTLWTVYITYT